MGRVVISTGAGIEETAGAAKAGGADSASAVPSTLAAFGAGTESEGALLRLEEAAVFVAGAEAAAVLAGAEALVVPERERVKTIAVKA